MRRSIRDSSERSKFRLARMSRTRVKTSLISSRGQVTARLLAHWFMELETSAARLSARPRITPKAWIRQASSA